MNIMNCIVIDDEAMARDIICHLIEKERQLNLMAAFEGPLEAMRYLNNNKDVDLIFLDVHMPGFTGFEFLQTMPSLPAVVLTTSDTDTAVNAFEYECIVDFLAKPVKEERFRKAVKMAMAWKKVLNSEEDKTEEVNGLFLTIANKLIKIDVESINFLEVKGEYLYVDTESRNYMVHATLFPTLEQKLPSEIFIKVHKTAIINIRKIIDIEEYSVLINNVHLPLTKPAKAALLKRLSKV